MMKSMELIFANLFSLLSQTQTLTYDATGLNPTPTGTPAFLTSSRRAPQVSNSAQAAQPALYMMQGGYQVTEKKLALHIYEFEAAAIILCANNGGPNQVTSTQLNNLADAVKFQLEQRTLAADGVTVIPLLAGLLQTLGGVVYHARVIGKVLFNEGLQNNQAAIVVPIKILSGM